jgi:hypothetical protein
MARNFMKCPVRHLLLKVMNSRLGWVGHAACTGEKCVWRLVQKPEGKRPLVRSRQR